MSRPEISSDRQKQLRGYVRLACKAIGEVAVKAPTVPVRGRTTLPNPIIDRLRGKFSTQKKKREAFVHQTVLRIADHCNIEIPRIATRFTDKDSEFGGRVWSKGEIWYIELNNRLRFDDAALVATIAHEMAHVVLLRSKIRITPMLTNEELTDVTAAMFGFGNYLRRVARRQRRLTVGTTTLIRTETLGYLSPSEFDYVMTIKNSLVSPKATLRRTKVNLRSAIWAPCRVCSDELELPRETGLTTLQCTTCRSSSQFELLSEELRPQRWWSRLLPRV